ncbi:replication factor-A protein 1 [Baffinella frigidus]|nr:replication factor-A protein 1 [Cryptophyta sp. CCMP2293]
MAEEAKLTRGAIQDITQPGKHDCVRYVLQVAELRLKRQNQNWSAVRVILSDGEQHCEAMFATQHNQLVFDGQLQNFSIIQVDESIGHIIQNRRVVLLTTLKVLGPPRAGLIGNPVSVDKFDVRAQRQLIEESKKNARRGIEEREAQERRAREERAAQELAAEEELHALFNRHGFFHTANNAGCSDDESYDPTEFVFEVAFPYPLMRCIPEWSGPEGVPNNVRFVSTSAAPNGKFFTVGDIPRALADSLNAKFTQGGYEWTGAASRGSFAIWDLTPPARAPVLAAVVRRVANDRCAKTLAFAMGLHPRLGAQAGMSVLEPEILRLICDAVPSVIRKELDAAAAAGAVLFNPALMADADAMRESIPIVRTTWCR